MGGIFGCDEDEKILIANSNKEQSTNEISKKSSNSGSEKRENIKIKDQKHKRNAESQIKKNKKTKNKISNAEENEEELRKAVFDFNSDNNKKNHSEENNREKINKINDRKKGGEEDFQINKNKTAINNNENQKFNDEEVINLNKGKEKEKEIQQKIITTSKEKRKSKHKLLEQSKEIESRKNSEFSDKDKKGINIEEFHFLEHYDSLKNIQESKEVDDKQNTILIYYFKACKLKKKLYKKNDFIEKYEFIYIQYNGKNMNFLFPKYKFKDKSINKDDIMKVIKDSLFCKKIEEVFNINLESKEKKFSLENINNSNKFNLLIEDIQNNTKIIGFNNQNLNNKDNNNEDIQDKNVNKENNTNINKDNNFNEEKNDKLENSNENKEKIKTDIVLKKDVKNQYMNNINPKENNIITNNNLNNNSLINSIPNIEKQINNNNLNIINSNINNNINSNPINIIQNYPKKIEVFYFPITGLNNIGSTCFMNATLQCLIHVPELSLYFLNEYPKDKEVLNNKNIMTKTKGQLSEAYYEVVKNVDDLSKIENNYYYNSYRPKHFKEILGTFNPQFSKYEANDSKDLILYLLQTFHEELNYFGDKSPPVIRPIYPATRENIYQVFNLNYNTTNFSKISQLFYGTYENTIICSQCKTIYYSYQKYEYISFSTYNYRNESFEIKNGFAEVVSKQELKGENKYHCNKCKKSVNAETYCKIIDLPLYLILNIDYGKDKKFDVKELEFEYEMDVKDFCSVYFGQRTKYKLISICSHRGNSGPTGHYYAYCLDKKNNKWYRFDDSSCKECDRYELKKYSPYLLIYELI